MNGIWTALWRWIYTEFLESLITPKGGTGLIEELGSGYSVEGAQMANVIKLQALCNEAVTNPNWHAHDITGDKINETFCNRAAQFIAQGMGFYGFKRDQFANEMIQAMSLDPKWREEPFEPRRITDFALKGVLVLIGVEDHPHGHVVAAAPEPAGESTSWGGPVPMVAQVGTAKIGNGIKKLSAAFKTSDRPRLRVFVYEESIS